MRDQNYQKRSSIKMIKSVGKIGNVTNHADQHVFER